MAPPEETPQSKPNPYAAFVAAVAGMQTAMVNAGAGMAQFCHALHDVRPKIAPMRVVVTMSPANAEEIGRQVGQSIRRARRHGGIWRPST